MAFNIARVAVRLVANTQEFQRGMRQAGRRLETFRRTASRIGKGVGLGLAAVFGAAAAGAAKLNLALNDLAIQIRQPVEQIQALAAAARAAGVTTSEFVLTMRRIARRVSDAASGNTQLQKTFARLNIDAEAFQKLDLVTQMKVLSARFKELGDDSAAQVTKFQLLDQEGQRVLQFFESAPAEIDGYIKKAKEMGVVNAEAASGFERMRRAFETGKSAVLGVFTRAAGGLFDIIFPPDASDRVKKANDDVIRGQFTLREALDKTALSAKKRNDILSGKTRSFGAAQINRSAEFLSFRRKGNPQEIRSKQIDTTNNLLRDIRSFMRNNTTGNTVTFSG